MSNVSQWAIFFVALGFLVLLIELDFRRAFRRHFMWLSLADILSPQCIPVFVGPMNMGPRGAMYMRLRYALWTILVATILYLIGLAAVTISVVGDAVNGLLPHYFMVARNAILAGDTTAQIGVIALLLFVIIRLPADLTKESRARLAHRTSSIRKLLSSYGTARDYYIEVVVLKDALEACRIAMRMDIEKNRLCERTLSPDAKKELIEKLRDECAQPSGASPHQILMGFINAEGAKQLDNRLRSASKGSRQEVRRRANLKIELRGPGDKNKIYCVDVNQVGIIDQHCVESFGLSTISLAKLPNGDFTLCGIAGKKYRRSVGVDVALRKKNKRTKEDRRYAVLRPKSSRLGRIFREHILRHS